MRAAPPSPGQTSVRRSARSSPWTERSPPISTSATRAAESRRTRSSVTSTSGAAAPAGKKARRIASARRSCSSAREVSPAVPRPPVQAQGSAERSTKPERFSSKKVSKRPPGPKTRAKSSSVTSGSAPGSKG